MNPNYAKYLQLNPLTPDEINALNAPTPKAKGNLATDIVKAPVRGLARLPDAIESGIEAAAGGYGKIADLVAGNENAGQGGIIETAVTSYIGADRDALTRPMAEYVDNALPYSAGTQNSQNELSQNIAEIQKQKDKGAVERGLESFGEAVVNPRGSLPSVLESIPEFMTGAAALKGAKVAAGLNEMGGLAGKVGQAGVIAGIGNAVLEGEGAERGTRQEMQNLSIDKLRENPQFMQLEAEHGTEEARRIATEQAGMNAFPMAGVTGAAASVVTGGGLEGALVRRMNGLTPKFAGGIVAEGLKGAGKEGLEEASQGYTGQVAQNLALNPYTGVAWDEGAAEQAGMGAGMGVLSGGAGGSLGATYDKTKSWLNNQPPPEDTTQQTPEEPPIAPTGGNNQLNPLEGQLVDTAQPQQPPAEDYFNPILNRAANGETVVNDQVVNVGDGTAISPEGNQYLQQMREALNPAQDEQATDQQEPTPLGTNDNQNNKATDSTQPTPQGTDTNTPAVVDAGVQQDTQAEQPSVQQETTTAEQPLVVKKDGKPFASEGNAKAQLSVKGLQKTHSVVPVEGGFALKATTTSQSNLDQENGNVPKKTDQRIEAPTAFSDGTTTTDNQSENKENRAKNGGTIAEIQTNEHDNKIQNKSEADTKIVEQQSQVSQQNVVRSDAPVSSPKTKQVKTKQDPLLKLSLDEVDNLSPDDTEKYYSAMSKLSREEYAKHPHNKGMPASGYDGLQAYRDEDKANNQASQETNGLNHNDAGIVMRDYSENSKVMTFVNAKLAGNYLKNNDFIDGDSHEVVSYKKQFAIAKKQNNNTQVTPDKGNKADLASVNSSKNSSSSSEANNEQQGTSKTSPAVSGTGAQAEIKKGVVGGEMYSGQVVLTSTGRKTTPYPKFNLYEHKDNPDKTQIFGRDVAKTNNWLIENAILEAESRGDDLTKRIFQADYDRYNDKKNKNRKYGYAAATKDHADEYLFGEVIPQRKSILKPSSQPTQETPNDKSTNPATQETTAAQAVDIESKIKRKDLFSIGGSFANELGGSNEASIPTEHREVNGIEFVAFSNPKTGVRDVVMTGTSGRDYVGFYRLYENGMPTEKWSSKFENQSGNKENFKKMIGGTQEMLPQGHEYTEGTSISTDGLRVWHQQLSKGYVLQYDSKGDLITNIVAINGDSLVNDLGINVDKGDFENISVTNNAQFESVKKALLPKLEKLGLNENNIHWVNGTVKIDLPILKRNKNNAAQNEAVKNKAKPATQFNPTHTVNDDGDIVPVAQNENGVWESQDKTEYEEGYDATPIESKVAAQDSEFGANNTLISKSRHEENLAKLRKKLGGTLNAGIDPELMQIGIESTVYYLEGGIRSFADVAARLSQDIGVSLETLKPYLRTWYNGARDMIEDSGLSIDGMDNPEQVKESLKVLLAEPKAEPAKQDKSEPIADKTEAKQSPLSKAIESGDIGTVLAHIEASKSSFGGIAKVLGENIPPNLKLLVVPELKAEKTKDLPLDQQRDIPSTFSLSDNAIKLSAKVLGESESKLAEYILHELAHAETVFALKQDKGLFRPELNNVIQLLKKHTKDTDGWLVAKNQKGEDVKFFNTARLFNKDGKPIAEELVAYGLTNTQLQVALQEIAYNSDKSLWDKFVDALAKSLGIPVKSADRTALAAVLKVSMELIDEQAGVSGKAQAVVDGINNGMGIVDNNETKTQQGEPNDNLRSNANPDSEPLKDGQSIYLTHFKATTPKEHAIGLLATALDTKEGITESKPVIEIIGDKKPAVKVDSLSDRKERQAKELEEFHKGGRGAVLPDQDKEDELRAIIGNDRLADLIFRPLKLLAKNGLLLDNSSIVRAVSSAMDETGINDDNIRSNVFKFLTENRNDTFSGIKPSKSTSPTNTEENTPTDSIKKTIADKLNKEQAKLVSAKEAYDDANKLLYSATSIEERDTAKPVADQAAKNLSHIKNRIELLELASKLSDFRVIPVAGMGNVLSADGKTPFKVISGDRAKSIMSELGITGKLQVRGMSKFIVPDDSEILDKSAVIAKKEVDAAQKEIPMHPMINHRADGSFGVKIPFDMKDAFKNQFSSAKWDEATKEWTVGKLSGQKLNAWLQDKIPHIEEKAASKADWEDKIARMHPLRGNTYGIKNELKERFGAVYDGKVWRVPQENKEAAQNLVDEYSSTRKTPSNDSDYRSGMSKREWDEEAGDTGRANSDYIYPDERRKFSKSESPTNAQPHLLTQSEFRELYPDPLQRVATNPDLDKRIIEKAGSNDPKKIFEYYQGLYPSELSDVDIQILPSPFPTRSSFDVKTGTNTDTGEVVTKKTIWLTPKFSEQELKDWNQKGGGVDLSTPSILRHEIEHAIDYARGKKDGHKPTSNPNQGGKATFKDFDHANFSVDFLHRALVNDALKEGLSVPDNVLADYPELKDRTGVFESRGNKPTNAHTLTSFTQAFTAQLDKQFGQGWTKLLMATGKVKVVSSEEADNMLSDINAYSFPKFSVRTDPAPKKTQIAYKLFRIKKTKPGELFPLFVKMGDDRPVPIGVWEDAEVGEQTDKGKVKSKLGPLAFRPGWHMGEAPGSFHIGGNADKKNGNKPTTRPDDQVWAEVEVSADVDWQIEADSRASKNKQGKIIANTAHLTDRLPTDGFYRYKTNANMVGQWIIAGSMKVTRVLTDAEVEQINKALGARPDLPRETPLDLEKFGFGKSGELNKKPANTQEFNANGNNQLDLFLSKNGKVQAFYNPADDTTYFVYDNIDKNKDLLGLAAHELGVHALQLGKNDNDFKAIMSEVDSMIAVNASKAVRTALSRAKEANTKPEHVTEEVLAYLVENHPRLTIVQKFLNWFRSKLRAIGKALPVIDRLEWFRKVTAMSESDLVGMAISALKSAPTDLLFDNVGRKDGGVMVSKNSQLLAPNGKPSNLNAVQHAQVRTPEFKAWFGDWENDPENASKVVDENGEPKPVWHGARKGGFTEFNTDGKNKTLGTGAWFTSTEANASTYSNNRKDALSNNGKNGNYQVFLNIRNPDVIDAEGKHWTDVGATDEWIAVDEDEDILDYFDNEDDANKFKVNSKNPVTITKIWIDETGKPTDQLAREAADNGHDGIIFNDIDDSGIYERKLDGNSNTYVAFNPNQIKSATSNTGAFSPDNNDIRYSKQQDSFDYDDELDNHQATLTNRAKSFFSEQQQRIIKKLLGSLPQQKKYRIGRYKTLGNLAKVEEITNSIYTTLSKASKDDAVAIYNYLTTKDADVSEIHNVMLRKAAKDVKESISYVGQQLVNAGFLEQATHDKYDGMYLPRVYLKHILGDDLFNALGSGKSLSDMGYLKQRKDIPEEVRRLILMEIKDPAYLAGRALNLPMRDIAIFNWLSQIADNKAWVWDQSYVTMSYTPEGQPEYLVTNSGDGVELQAKQDKRFKVPTFKPIKLKPKSVKVKVTPFFLSQEAARMRHQAHAAPEADRADILALADMYDAVANQAISGMEAEGMPQDFKEMPKSKRYGALAGAVVRKEIYNDIVGVSKFSQGNESFAEKLLGDGGLATKYVSFWKFMKVAANPPAQVRNMISNLVLLHVSGVAFHRVIPRYIQAWREVLNNGVHYQIGKKYGITQSSFSNSELFRMNNELNELVAKNKDKNDFERLVAFTKLYAGRTTDKLSDLYQFTESVGKVAKIIDEMAKGASEEDAILAAHDALFDYTDVSPSVKWLRNAPLGSPFVTFNIKVLPALIKGVAKNPLMPLPYFLGFTALSMAVAAMAGVDDDDLDKLKKALPEWMQKRGNAYFLPYKDSLGRWQALDFGYFLPWNSYQQLAKQAFHGDMLGVGETTGLFGSPVVSLATAIKTGKDSFTDKDIVNKFDTPAQQLGDIMNYLWRMNAPTFLTDMGAVGNPFKLFLDGHIARAITGEVDRQGNAKSTVTQAALRMVGVNIYSIDPENERAKNIRRKSFEIDEARSELKKETRDLNASDSAKKNASKHYRELIGEMADDLSQYIKDSEVHPKLRVKKQK